MYFLQRKDCLPPKTTENKGKFYYVNKIMVDLINFSVRLAYFRHFGHMLNLCLCVSYLKNELLKSCFQNEKNHTYLMN